MSRPRKQTVDYFPHCTTHKKTIYILEQQFGNDGYAFWFKLLEVLGSTDGHIYNTKDSKNWFYLISRAGVDTDTGTSILNLLSSLEAIDHELWSKGIIWCQNFVDNLTPLYKKRMEEIPSKPVSGVRNPVSGVRNPQRIGKDSKGKDNKEGNGYRPDWFSKELWDELIANRKMKKLSTSKLALTTICNSFKGGLDAGYSLEVCVAAYVSSKWARFDYEWLRKEHKNDTPDYMKGAV